MKIRCAFGFFILEEIKVGQVSDFMSRFGLSIVPWQNKFTFEDLVDVPEYVFEGQDLLGLPAVASFEGEPWEIFEANEFVYDFNAGLMVPIATVTQSVQIQVAGNFYISSGLILPGSITDDGERVRDYSAWYSRDTQRFTYSEVTYV